VNKGWPKQLFELALIAVGSSIMALSYTLFLIPLDVIPGGVGGIAMILNKFFGTPVGLVSIALNVPLFVVAVRVLGKTYGAKSVVGMLSFSLQIDFFTYLVPTGRATENPILACIFGGVMLGGGLGLVFRGGGSTGGSDIVGMVLCKWTNLSTGTAILLVDLLVITIGGLVYGKLELALFGYVNLYLQSQVIDVVLEGISYTRAMLIISDHSAAIARAITAEMGRGATYLRGAGAYTEAEKDVLLAVMTKKEIAQARDLIRGIDPRAFVIITDVYDVQGEGFKPRTD